MVSLVHSPQELGLGRGELAIGQRALLVQRGQRLEFGRNRWRRHDHAVGCVAWNWRAEPVWVVAPRMIPNSPMAARQGRIRVAVPPVPRDFLPDGRGRVVLPPGLRRRIRPEPVIDRSVARPQRGGSGRERRCARPAAAATSASVNAFIALCILSVSVTIDAYRVIRRIRALLSRRAEARNPISGASATNTLASSVENPF